MKKNAIVLVIYSFAACLSLAQAADRYQVRQEMPDIGSNIKRSLAIAQAPLNKLYEELTKEQQDGIKASYASMSDGDEPPFPKRGLNEIVSNVVQAQDELMVKGLLTAVAAVDEYGDVGSVAFYKSPDERMAQAVAYILTKTKFKPAKCNGLPCKMDYIFNFEFTLH